MLFVVLLCSVGCVTCCDFVLSGMCVVGGVLLWVICVLVSVLHPVTILKAVFCVICILLMFVSDASDDHIWWTRIRLWILLWLCEL